jgi:hypothetical protein
MAREVLASAAPPNVIVPRARAETWTPVSARNRRFTELTAQ